MVIYSSEKLRNIKWAYEGKKIINRNYIRNRIKSRLNSGKACSYLRQKSLFSCALYEGNIKMHKTVIEPILLYECCTFLIRRGLQCTVLKVFRDKMLNRRKEPE
jgi:hypothetical protein